MIRPRRAEDLDRCVRLLRAVHAADRYPAIWPAEPAAWLEGRQAIVAWVADYGGEVLGHLALTAPDPDRSWPQWREALGVGADGLAVVRRFFVAPRSRRIGVGGSLLRCAHAEAADRGLHLVLDVAEHNHAAISFYEHRGWHRVGEATLPLDGGSRVLPLVLLVAPG